MVEKLLERHYGYLFEPDLLREIADIGTLKTLEQGTQLMDIGQDVSSIPLVLSGAIKIMREDSEGDELLLYFIEMGDSCTMTFSCCMGTGKSEIRAVAETDTELIVIPVEKMDPWMAAYPGWRRFVMDSYHARMMELMETVDALAFMNLDRRLLKYLKDRAMVTHDDVIHTTHLEVANDLHTSRVVISRLLKKLGNEGKIRLQRNAIKVLDI